MTGFQAGYGSPDTGNLMDEGGTKLATLWRELVRGTLFARSAVVASSPKSFAVGWLLCRSRTLTKPVTQVRSGSLRASLSRSLPSGSQALCSSRQRCASRSRSAGRWYVGRLGAGYLDGSRRTGSVNVVSAEKRWQLTGGMV